MPLVQCHRLEGTETIVEQDPAILTLQNVVYIPVGYQGSRWGGIHDHGGRLVPLCGQFRGPDAGALDNDLLMPLRYGDVAMSAPDEVYVFGGFIHAHYGHFLLSTLSRYWALHKIRAPGVKILYHSNLDIVDLLQRPFVADLFGALGLGAEDFISFAQPVQINRLIVPGPSFEETGFAHRAFSGLALRLGDILLEEMPVERSEVPIYLSKAKLPHGVGHLVNEEEFSDVLSGRGMEIVHPEQLSLARQIALVRSRPLIAALTGSALHTGIFASGHTAVGLSYGDVLYSSYTMLDRISDTQGSYFHPHGEIELLPRSAEFHLHYRLTDVRRTAEQFLRVLEMKAQAARRRVAFSLPSSKLLREPFSWPNVAKGKHTRQSSFGPREILDTPAGYRSTATSGMLTGLYQFHTDHEDQPWWDVDLLDQHEMFEIRLHNRSDNSQERASRFMILASRDDVVWTELHRQDTPLAFGNGLEDRAFSWIPHGSVRARLIRVMLLDRNFLHLDQVEIFGRPLSSVQPVSDDGKMRV